MSFVALCNTHTTLKFFLIFQALVVHYENVKHDTLSEMFKVLDFFHMPIDQNRLQCLQKHKDGLFQREASKTPEVVPFSASLRKEIDRIIDHVNVNILQARGYDPMPTHLYSFYGQTDSQILTEIQSKNDKIRNVRIQNEQKEVENARKSDRTHGTKMVLEQYIKWLDLEDEHFDVSREIDLLG